MDKKFFKHLFALCIVAIGLFVFAVCAGGCASTGGLRQYTDGAVIEYQRQVDENQAQLQYYVGRLDAAAEAVAGIRRRAEEGGATVDDVIREFEEYQHTVELLLRYYKDLRSRIIIDEKEQGQMDCM